MVLQGQSCGRVGRRRAYETLGDRKIAQGFSFLSVADQRRSWRRGWPGSVLPRLGGDAAGLGLASPRRGCGRARSCLGSEGMRPSSVLPRLGGDAGPYLRGLFGIRSRTLVIAGASMGIVLGVCAGWFWWLPAHARGVMREQLAAMGLEGRVEEVRLGLSSTSLEGLEIRQPGGGMRMEVPELRVEAPLLGLASRGRAAIIEIRLEGGLLELDLDSPRLRSWIERARGGGSDAETGGDTGAEARMPGLRARDLRVAIRHGGDALELEEVALRLEAGIWRLEAAQLDASAAAGHGIRLEGVRALARSASGSPELVSFSCDRASIGLRSAEPGSGGAALAPEEPGEAADPLEGSEAGASLLPAGPAIAEASIFGGPALASVLGHLAPDVQILLEDMHIRSLGEGQPRELMDELDLRVEGLEGAGFRFSGRGEAGGGGEVSWSLSLSEEGAARDGNVRLHDLSLALLAPLLPSVPLYAPERARVDAELRIEARAEAQVGLSGSLSLRQVALSSARLAPHPVHELSLSLDGEAGVALGSGRVSLERASITIGRVRLNLQGSFEALPGGFALEVDAVLPSTSCDELIEAIPEDLLGELTSFGFEGRLGGSARIAIDTRRLGETELSIDLADACRFVLAPALADPTRFAQPFLHRVEEPDGTIFEMWTGPGTETWTSLHALSPFAAHAILAHEDASFFRHSGFATWAIRDSISRNLREGRFAVGASTISMQLARNLYLNRDKTLSRKIQEVLLTWWLERQLSKAQLFELYVNVIEYGPAIYGIRNASRHYFGLEPDQLGLAQAAFLAVVLPSPIRFHQSYERGALSERMAGRVQRFMRRMAARGRIDAAALTQGLADLSRLRFHAPGDPPATPRPHAGRAGPLPFSTPSVAELGAMGAFDAEEDEAAERMEEGDEEGLDE